VVTNRGMDEVVRSLAGILIQAGPLAVLLDSPRTAAEYRTNLREAVGHERYEALTRALHAMRSRQAWDEAHAPEAKADHESSPP
jgi:hypothetical protein